jgi:hypothetical protein
MSDKIKKELIKTDNYLLVVDDSEIKVGDVITDKYNVWTWKDDSSLLGRKKVIAHLPLNNSPIIEGVPLLPPLEQEDDINKLAYEKWKKSDERSGNPPYIYRIGYNEGYNKAKEKYKYTEEDILKAWNAAYIDALAIDEINYKPLFFDNFIQSLQQPSRPTHFECETITMNKGYTDELDVPYQEIEVPKTTTNSQGQEVACGKYI